MGEPYANYKNRAAKELATICISDSNYNEALHFLELTKKYPYRHFCGNEFAADEIQMAILYGKCYLGLKNYPAVYNTLLPHIIPNGLANNTELINVTYKALLISYSKVELKNQFEKAVKKYKIEHGDTEKGILSRHSLVFLGTKIEENLSYDFELVYSRSEQEKALRKMLLDSEFYKLLKN